MIISPSFECLASLSTKAFTTYFLVNPISPRRALIRRDTHTYHLETSVSSIGGTMDWTSRNRWTSSGIAPLQVILYCLIKSHRRRKSSSFRDNSCEAGWLKCSVNESLTVGEELYPLVLDGVVIKEQLVLLYFCVLSIVMSLYLAINTYLEIFYQCK